MCRFEGQISGKNIEIGIIGTDRQFRHFCLLIICAYCLVCLDYSYFHHIHSYASTTYQNSYRMGNLDAALGSYSKPNFTTLVSYLISFFFSYLLMVYCYLLLKGLSLKSGPKLGIASAK